MRVSGDTVTYPAIARGVNLGYQVTPQSLTERITLTSPSAASSFSYTVRVGGGLIPYQRPDGSIAFSRDGAGGAPAVIMPKPFMTDSRHDAQSPYGYRWSPKVSQAGTWDARTRTLRLSVTADPRWLRQAGRVFPVVIDPTIEIAPTPAGAQNTMIASDPGEDSQNFSSTYRMEVGTDAGGASRALLYFPLDTVPPATQIDSADLNLYYDQTFGPASANETIDVDQANAPWLASTATWANANNNVGPLGLNEIVTGDADSSHTAASGTWPSQANSNAINGGYRYNKDTVSGDTFTWTPQVTEPGNYFLAYHYVQSASAASNAPVTVHYNGGSKPFTVNQQSGTGGVWDVLDNNNTYPFTTGTAGSFVLGDGPASASTMVEADAVRLRKWAQAKYDGVHANHWDGFAVRNIVQSWVNHSSANDGLVVKSDTEGTPGQGGPVYEGSANAYNGETATYPQLVVTYIGNPGVTLNQITTIHATGAQLSWPAYQDPTPGTNPGDDVAEYQVHRSADQTFTPSADTLVAPVDGGTTSFTDTTATPTPPGGQGNAYYYMVVVKTRDGTVIPGPAQLVRLPTAGSTVQVIDASGDTTLSSAQPATSQQQLSGQPWLATGDNSATYGTTRTVVGYPSMTATGIPSDATVSDAELKLWGWNNNTRGGSATYEAHALTQDFDPATATWNNASSGNAWTTAGGSYSPAVAGTTAQLTNDPDRQQWPVASTVQDWITNPGDEHGLLVKLSGETSSDPQEQELFLNSSAPEPALRPELVVTYSEPTPQDTYYVPQLPDPLAASSSYTVNVTLTNTTASTWNASDWVLSYHWLLPDGTDVSDPSDQAQTPLAANMAPSSAATIAATLQTPDGTGSGDIRSGYTLAWDLYNKTTGTWLSNGVIGGTNAAAATRLQASTASTGAASANVAGAHAARAVSFRSNPAATAASQTSSGATHATARAPSRAQATSGNFAVSHGVAPLDPRRRNRHGRHRGGRHRGGPDGAGE